MPDFRQACPLDQRSRRKDENSVQDTPECVGVEVPASAEVGEASDQGGGERLNGQIGGEQFFDPPAKL